MNDDIDITAIIPVRLGSTRCKHKNIRSIGDTSLLKKKLDLLNQVPYIKHIIVSTSDKIVIDIINEYNKLNNSNILIHLRDSYYSQTNTTGTELFKCLSESIKTQHMMYVTCVTPFVTKNDYINAICLYKKYQITKEYDSIVSCGNIKDFLWKDNKSLNYDSFNAQPSQLLPDIYNLTFAFNILSTEFVRNNHSIIGLKPYFYELDQISEIDIDTEYDFLITELLYKNGFRTIDDISKYLSVSECINKKIYLLDCTIRDGGFLNNWKYSLENVIEYYKIISNCEIDFFECGFICNDFNKDYGDWWSVTPNLIQKLKNSTDNGSKIAAMILVENMYKLTTKINDLDMIRILINLKKIKISKEIISDLKRLYDLGYILTINIAYIDILNENEIVELIEILQPLSDIITCIYIADTFGSIIPFNLLKHIRQFSLIFKNVGFHGHNNLNLALSNSILAIDNGVKYIDCTINGIGRGGGNTSTELLLIHLNKTHDQQYNIIPLLDYLDTVLNNDDKLKILYTLSGLKKTHPDIVLEMFNDKDKLSNLYIKLINY